LPFRQRFGVKGQLKDRGPLRHQGKLAVVNFIGPRSKTAWLRCFTQNIRTAKPTPLPKGPMRDQVDSLFHERGGSRNGLCFTRNLPKIAHRKTQRTDIAEIGSLMFQA